MTSGAAALLRREDPPTATFVELLFDVVFVLALVMLSLTLMDDLTGTARSRR